MRFVVENGWTVELVKGELRFRDPEGRLVAAGNAGRVVPQLEAGLAHLDEPRGRVEGRAVRGLCTFDFIERDLVAGREGNKVTFLWRDPHGRVVDRIELHSTAVTRLAEWLHTLDVPRPRPPDVRNRRAALILAIDEVEEHWRKVQRRGGTTTELDGLRRTQDGLRAQYLETLTSVPIARNPFDSKQVELALDVFGLDGPFWDADRPARPITTGAPGFVVLTGAMRLDRTRLRRFSHLCLPGPEVPYVLPALLGKGGISAVLRTVAIGPHQGFAVAYFNRQPGEPRPIANQWGQRRHWDRQEGAPLHRIASDGTAVPDFELEPWIARGKLSWIAPGDPTLTLRSDVEDCPFIGLEGERHFQQVQFGTAAPE